MKILELELNTRNLSAMQNFYTHALELPLLQEQEKSFIVQAGSTKLTFREVTGTEGVYHFAFNIPKEKIEEATAWLQGKAEVIKPNGSNSSMVHHEEWQAYAVYFSDPDGNILELIARQTFDTPPTNEPFSSTQILHVSELGIAAPDVTACTSQLKAKLGIKRYQSATEKFEAVGDEEGLFIVVEQARAWFPTTTQAAILPARVVLRAPSAETIRCGAVSIVLQPDVMPQSVA